MHIIAFTKVGEIAFLIDECTIFSRLNILSQAALTS